MYELAREPEEWVIIQDYPSYAVSNYGKVMHIRTQKPVRPQRDDYGFLKVNLWHEKRNHRKSVHHLVAQAFLQFYRNDRQIYHHDGNKRNNYVYNLRYSSNHQITNLRQRRETLVFLSYIQIVETGQVFKTIRECANKTGLDVSAIYKVLSGKRKTHKGYTLRRIERHG